MRVTIKIESHAFVDEHLCDEILDPTLPDDPDSCGVAGAEIIIPLRRNRTAEFEFCYTEETTLGDVVHAILEKYHLLNCGIRVSFYSHEVRYWVVDSNANFKVTLEKYLDPSSKGEIRTAIFVSLDAGTVCNDGQLRYIVNSREAGKHHQPHVHVCTPSHDYEAAISILDGCVLAGALPPKLLRKAQQKVINDRLFFINCWNTLSDGLRVDVNHYLGLIQY